MKASTPLHDGNEPISNEKRAGEIHQPFSFVFCQLCFPSVVADWSTEPVSRIDAETQPWLTSNHMLELLRIRFRKPMHCCNHRGIEDR